MNWVMSDVGSVAEMADKGLIAAIEEAMRVCERASEGVAPPAAILWPDPGDFRQLVDARRLIRGMHFNGFRRQSECAAFRVC